MKLNKHPSLTEDQIRINLILKIADLGFWDFGPNDENLEWSSKGKSLFGVSDDQPMTYSMLLAGLHPEDRERIHATIQKAFEPEVGGYAVEFRTIGIEDGIERTIRASGEVYFDNQKIPIQLIGVSSDITAQREYEASLQVAKVSAESASRAKSEFLANISHEIRTPLGAILGFAELAADSTYNEVERQKFLLTVRRIGEQLSELINQVLDLSKIEENRIELESVVFSLPIALKEVIVALEIGAIKKGVTINLSSDGKIPQFIDSDQLRFKQILFNIIGNAVKFTDEGSISIRAKVISPLVEGKPMTVAITIHDTGIGIAKSRRSELFQRFSQGDTSVTRRHGGTGLGLILAKELAVALGGDLVLVDSSVGEGSTFTFSFSAGQYAADSPFVALTDDKEMLSKTTFAGTDNSSLDGIRLLVVDDSEDNQEMLARTLSSAGARVEIAPNGEDAVQKALSGEFDLILMDLQMPVLDGVEATQRLRKAGFKKPIIAISAHALKSDRQKSISQGFNEHLTKPIRLGELIREVAQHTRGPHASLH